MTALEPAASGPAGPDLVVATEQAGPVTVISLGGSLADGDPRRLAERLSHPTRVGAPVVVDLTDLRDLEAPQVDELLWRLAAAPGHASTLLIHTELGTRRSLRRRTALPVLPSLEVALAGRIAAPVATWDPVHVAADVHRTRRPRRSA